MGSGRVVSQPFSLTNGLDGPFGDSDGHGDGGSNNLKAGDEGGHFGGLCLVLARNSYDYEQLVGTTNKH